ncbi:MAG: 30S ribosomal protein S9 [candidate division Zixibacteria bacterium]|nr:30S ribosomal protein S9 [candidate division Zixibacteria bacterium]
MLANEYFLAKGTRKTAIAQIRIKSGTGKVLVNGREMLQYLCRQNLVTHVMAPLEETKLMGKIDVIAKVKGGGLSGQAGALRLGLTRALVKYDATLRAALKKQGFLTRDARMVERKKYGQAKARKRFQFSKR